LALELNAIQAQPQMTVRAVAEHKGTGVNSLWKMNETMIDTW
jgi:hypothetical protein